MTRTVPLAILLAVISAAAATAAELRLNLPLNRTAYQTNERIDLTVTRPAAGAGDLRLTLSGADGSVMSFTFPVTRITEHLHVNGALLRPGKYTVEVADGAATDQTTIELFSHIRQSSYRLVNWGRAQDPQDQLPQGEAGFGYNLFYAHYANDAAANLLRAGVDVIGNCVMSGGHQMDLRAECDWSDPYASRGGTQRVVRRALEDRSRGNVLGVHFYDEPGLTWRTEPATGESTPHGVPSQLRSYEAAFPEDRPQEPRRCRCVETMGDMEARVHGRGVEGSAIWRQLRAAGLSLARAEPVRLDGDHGWLLLQRDAEPHQRPRRL